MSSSDRTFQGRGAEVPCQSQTFGSDSSDSSIELTKLQSQHEDKDPFTTPRAKAKPEQQLSATAPTFQPIMFRLNNQGQHDNSSYGQQAFNASAVNVGQHGTFEPVTALFAVKAGTTQFSTDTRVTRALRISGIYAPIVREQVESCLEEKGIPEKATRRFYNTSNEVFVRFSDVVDAADIYNYARRSHPEWTVDYVSPGTCGEKSNPGSPFVSSYEGQVMIVAKLPGTNGHDMGKFEKIVLELLEVEGPVYAHQTISSTETGTLRMIAEFRDVGSAHQAVARLNGQNLKNILFSVALHKPDVDYRQEQIRATMAPQQTPVRPRPDLNDVMGSIGRMALGGPPMFSPQTAFPYGSAVLSPTGRSFIPGGFPMTPNFAGMPVAFPAPFASPHTPATSFGTNTYCSPSQYGGTSVASGSPRFIDGTPRRSGWENMGGSMGSPSPVRGGMRGDFQDPNAFGRRQNAIRGASRPAFNNSVGQHNVVDVDRIRQGLDVRTTIMLRNIPNKIDQAMLKGIIDETSFGLYDFMYLRIDFANNCNVGYAFINFEDPWHIINFVEARSGQRWNRFNSDKVAEVSYATIQGKDCLVQKFRNSSVMLEHPSFRPKIFYAGNHPNAGEEEEFPLPDNASKMRRSVENAEHVGLFAPRAGQHYRDEQRRRRSQFDRGTRLAALEEYEYEESMSYSNGVGGSNYHY